ncbi:HPt (histidine-containing phosphotransfer) domain-containing protein [Acetitomaculum ruminis DSM 5522]|uniref:HPt (Histidine-containing phosphotransfer) domain-containing protein n=1 Tax=Acetitomaculum ruminis DSM 5522 TaxID=1120918 RepID=A0A1I0XAW9_9FIRM|nr:Hpt domain-containing protein [Acetitomaculum ruminis]SFA97566.1 HPt (histidine-containing phosphotransfer) domain-containing protein [Acetitomaculum ruminis DSM 5522]
MSYATAKELYSKIGGNYEKMIGIFKTDDMVKEFAKMFLDDNSAIELDQAMKNEDYAAAFEAAHKLKGVTLNIALDDLGAQATEVVERLRNQKDIEGAKIEYPKLQEMYKKVIDAIKELN